VSDSNETLHFIDRFFEKPSSIKFRENPSSSMRTDRQRRSCWGHMYLMLCIFRAVMAFRKFSNARPKKI